MEVICDQIVFREQTIILQKLQTCELGHIIMSTISTSICIPAQISWTHCGILFFQMEPVPASVSVPVEAEAPAAALGELEQRSTMKEEVQEEEPMEQEESAPQIQEEAGDTVSQVVQIDNKHLIYLFTCLEHLSIRDAPIGQF